MATTPGQAAYRQFVVDSIRLYRSLPALWDLKSKEYRDREKKMEAYDLMAAKFQELYPDATRETVKRKFNILRTNYRKELKKVLAGGHQPNLWYYHEFAFLDGIEDFGSHPRMPLNYSTSSSSPATNYEEPARVLPKYECSSGGEEDSFAQYGGVSSPNGRDRSPPARHSWEQNGEYQAVGYNVGAKLQKMTAEQQIYAELLVNKILARGLLGTLSNRTDLNEE